MRVAVDVFKGDTRVKHDIKTSAKLLSLYRRHFNLSEEFLFQYFGQFMSRRRCSPHCSIFFQYFGQFFVLEQDIFLALLDIIFCFFFVSHDSGTRTLPTLTVPQLCPYCASRFHQHASRVFANIVKCKNNDFKTSINTEQGVSYIQLTKDSKSSEPNYYFRDT